MLAWKQLKRELIHSDFHFFHTKNGVLLLGDCLTVMRKVVPAKSVDLIVTSPPYNLGNRHHTDNNYFYPYFDDMPEDEYQEWQIEVLNECYRFLKETGSMMYNHKNRIRKGIMITPYQWILRSKFILKQEIVWVNGSPNFDKIRFYPHTERIYWLAKSRKTKLVNVLNKPDFFTHSDWKPVGTKEKHKRMFPEKMAEDLIAVFPDAQIVLDPFMGGGTVAVACERMGRKWVGIEINPDFCSFAKERILGKTRYF